MGRAGELDRKIRIERATVGRDATGGVTDDGWTPLCRPWAKRSDASDGERFEAEETAATRMTRFKVRSSDIIKTVTPADRIFQDGAFYEITGIKETAEGRNRFVEFTTVVRNDQARDL